MRKGFTKKGKNCHCRNPFKYRFNSKILIFKTINADNSLVL